jgi:nickel/cobalt transporter (NicO) family protein
VIVALALVAAAVGIGSVHTLAPDHWAPFGALARAERWSAKRTVAVTAACGLGHVTGSVVLGLLSVFFGLEVLQRFGRHLESASGLLLIGFGVAYAAWSLHRSISARTHAQMHAHGHVHRHAAHGHRAHDVSLTPWTLFLLFSADPCVAVIPLIFAAAPLGWGTTVAVIVAYETATIATMVLLVLPARAAATAVRGVWVDRYGDAFAGALVATVGIAVVVLGM